MSKVAVLMPVYNGERFVEKAITSILNQSFQDFVFIIIDDGSTDNTYRLIKSFKDTRIKLFKNNQNKGLIYSLNLGLRNINTEFIVRMDSDDVAHPNRIEIQIKFMEQNPDYVMCGSNVKIIPSGIIKQPPSLDFEIRTSLIFNNVFYHSSVMIRSSVLFNNKINYENEFYNCEDYRLWTRLSCFGKMKNLDFLGIEYRDHINQITKNVPDNYHKKLEEIRFDYLKNVNIEFTRYSFENFDNFCNNVFLEENEIIDLIGVFYKIYNSNFRGNNIVRLFLFKKFIMYLNFLNKKGIYTSKYCFLFQRKFRIFSIFIYLKFLIKDAIIYKIK